MLYARRKRQDELARREAEGEDLWTPDLDANARARLVHVMKSVRAGSAYGTVDALRSAHASICSDIGVFDLGGDAGAVARGQPEDDLLAAVLRSDVDMVATAVEAVRGIVADQGGGNPAYNRDLARYDVAVRTILAEHRVSFDFIDGQMVPFESREMHVGVVEPTLRLLGGRAEWDGVERAYRKALQEIGTDPADAVTDAGTALQVALEALGCDGNALGPLGKSAVGKGLLSGHDVKLVDWVGADRSQTGDTHNADPVTRDDAWFAVHIVGALLLRLAGDMPRG